MRNKLVVTFFAVLFFSRLFAQDPLDQNITALNRYVEENPIEKAYLQLDRSAYFPGDTIWFKAYVVAGVRHHLSKLSRVLYIELVDDKDSVEKRLTMQLTVGMCNGEFAIAYDAKPGFYRVRAYTNWMRNAGDAYFYDEPVPVLGFAARTARLQGRASPAVSVKQDPPKIDLQFFPEGGEMINNLRSKIAFKAVGPNGLGVEVSGKIVNDVGTEEATFASEHLGMGSLMFEPQKGESYFAKITTADGKTQTVPLPKAKDAGFLLAVVATSDTLFVKVTDRNMPDTAFYLVGQSDGRYYVSTGDRLTSKFFIIPVPKSVFPSGIVQFTLFSQAGRPLNERLVFVQNADRINLSLTPDKPIYATGEAAQLSLQAADHLGVADIGHFSVSVVDTARVPSAENTEPNILSGLLLKSELGGYLEQPGYYFAHPNQQTEAALDLLMLTQGYHRYDWNKLRAYQDFTPKYHAENGFFTISGAIRSLAGKLLPNAPVALICTRPVVRLDTTTNEQGRFVFDGLNLPDTAKVVISAAKANGEDVQISFDKPAAPPPVRSLAGTPYASIAENYNAGEARTAYAAWKNDSLKNVIQLKQVDIKGSKTPALHPDYKKALQYSANLNGPGAADQVIVGDQFGTCTSLVDCLHWLIRGNVKWIGDQAYSLHKSTELILGTDRPMAVELDGVIMDQPTAYAELSPQDIAGVEVLASLNYAVIYGERASAGLIVITTKHGGEGGINPPARAGMATYRFPRYDVAREFYSPRYTVTNTQPLADNRKTIFWAPDVTTNANGKALLEFCNGSTPGTYRVVVEGIDENGRIGRGVFTYKVQ